MGESLLDEAAREAVDIDGLQNVTLDTVWVCLRALQRERPFSASVTERAPTAGNDPLAPYKLSVFDLARALAKAAERLGAL